MQALETAATQSPPILHATRDLLEDEALVSLARGGDTLAYEALVRRHQSWLLRAVARVLPRSEDAEDVVQETLVRAYGALGNYRGDCFRGWLRRIGLRTASNWKRGNNTRSRYERWKVSEDGVEETPCGESRAASRQLLETVFGEIDDDAREILVLRYLEELTVEQIAEQLGVGRSAVKMRLLRARAKFKELVGEDSEAVKEAVGALRARRAPTRAVTSPAFAHARRVGAG